MNIYGTTINCLKCGHKNFNDRYSENVSGIAGNFIIEAINGDEVIVRTCNNCGFVFLEAPLDSEQSQGVGG